MLLDASRHNNGVQFLGIGTPKCGPNLMCFAHFHLEMCFSSQQSAIFGHRHVKKCFGTLNFFSILTSKCASRHSGVQFFDIGTSKSGPTLTCFPHFHLKMSSGVQFLDIGIGTSKSGTKLTCFVHFCVQFLDIGTKNH